MISRLIKPKTLPGVYKNAIGFAEMAEAAAKLGGKVNGYSEAELRQSATEYDAAAKAH